MFENFENFDWNFWLSQILDLTNFWFGFDRRKRLEISDFFFFAKAGQILQNSTQLRNSYRNARL